MKIKTSELIGNALNWAVAKCNFPSALDADIEVWVQPLPCDDPDDFKFQPSTDWAQGGPIIEREKILLDLVGPDDDQEWEGRVVGKSMEYGPTPLVAAMRCYVGTKLGNEVDVPEVCLDDK